MSAGSKIGITAVLLLFLGGLAAADMLSTEGGNLQGFLTDTADDGTEPADDGAESSEGSSAVMVYKNSGPLLADVAGQLNMSLQESKEPSLVAEIAAGKAQTYSQAILKDNDRIGTVTWLESSLVKTMFIALKEALTPEFSDQLKDLRDETLQEEGRPVRNVLSFSDPAIAPEQVILVRVRERIYEFHVAPGKEADMQALRQALTEK